MKLFKPLWTVTILTGFAFSLQGDVIVPVTVDGLAMPWQWVNGGLNTNFHFGSQDGLGPAVLDASSGISFGSGGMLTITYMSGLTGAFPGDPPVVNGIGYGPNAPSPFVFDASDSPGNSGHFFASLYMGPYPIYLNALVATFADSTGSIVGTPFAVNNGPVTIAIPVGATRLQFGVNDDIFADNSGSLNLQVSGPAEAIPEPSFTLPLACLAGFVVFARRRFAPRR